MLKILKRRRRLSSLEQLAYDFGEYPPNPLKATLELSQNHLTVYRMTKWRMFRFKLTLAFEMMRRSRRNEWGDLSPELGLIMNQVWIQMREGLGPIAENFALFRREISSGNVWKRIKNGLSLIAYTFLMSLFLLVTIPYALIRLWRAFDVVPKGVRGFYFGVGNGKTQLFLNENEILQDGDKSIEAVQSHEHLHMLQSYWADKLKIQRGNGTLKNNEFLRDEYRENKWIQYLLNQREVEARLHEFVLTHYQVAGELPKDYAGFLIMILGNLLFLAHISSQDEKILDEFISALSQIDADFRNKIKQCPEDDIRDQGLHIELAKSIMVLKGGGIRFRFISEVLAVMYANLLVYYGDQDTSLAFLETVPSVALAHEMYENPSVHRA